MRSLFHREWAQCSPRALDFDDKPIVVAGYCQLGKSREILLAAWRAVFEYEMLPIIWVRTHGGHEAVAQLRSNLEDFNCEIQALHGSIAGAMKSSSPPVLVAKDEYELDSGDAQVVITLANASRVRQIVRHELPRLSKRTCALGGKTPIVVICDEDDLNVTSSRRDQGKIEKAIEQLRGHAFQDVSVTATLTAVLLTGRPGTCRCIGKCIEKVAIPGRWPASGNLGPGPREARDVPLH